MGTPFENLQKEVRVLRREIKRLKGSPASNQAAVAEIVGPTNDHQMAGGESAFSRALREDATTDGQQQQHREIVNALRTNPELIINPTAEWAFRHNYPWIDYATMSGLIDEATGRTR